MEKIYLFAFSSHFRYLHVILFCVITMFAPLGLSQQEKPSSLTASTPQTRFMTDAPLAPIEAKLNAAFSESPPNYIKAFQQLIEQRRLFYNENGFFSLRSKVLAPTQEVRKSAAWHSIEEKAFAHWQSLSPQIPSDTSQLSELIYLFPYTQAAKGALYQLATELLKTEPELSRVYLTVISEEYPEEKESAQFVSLQALQKQATESLGDSIEPSFRWASALLFNYPASTEKQIYEAMLIAPHQMIRDIDILGYGTEQNIIFQGGVLKAMQHPGQAESENVDQWLVNLLNHKLVNQTGEILTTMLRDKNLQIQANAARRLGLLSRNLNESNLTPLLDALLPILLQEWHPEAQREATRTFGKLVSVHQVPPSHVKKIGAALRTTLKNPAASVRSSAATAIGYLIYKLEEEEELKELTEALLNALSDSDESVRLTILSSLKELTITQRRVGYNSKAEKKIRLLLHHDSAETVRSAALEALENLLLEDSIGPLALSLIYSLRVDKSSIVRARAARLLGNLADRLPDAQIDLALEALLSPIKKGIDLECSESIAALLKLAKRQHIKQVSDALFEAMTNPSPEVSLAVASAWTQIIDLFGNDIVPHLYNRKGEILRWITNLCIHDSHSTYWIAQSKILKAIPLSDDESKRISETIVRQIIEMALLRDSYFQNRTVGILNEYHESGISSIPYLELIIFKDKSFERRLAAAQMISNNGMNFPAAVSLIEKIIRDSRDQSVVFATAPFVSALRRASNFPKSYFEEIVINSQVPSLRLAAASGLKAIADRIGNQSNLASNREWPLVFHLIESIGENSPDDPRFADEVEILFSLGPDSQSSVGLYLERALNAEDEKKRTKYFANLRKLFSIQANSPWLKSRNNFWSEIETLPFLLTLYFNRDETTALAAIRLLKTLRWDAEPALNSLTGIAIIGRTPAIKAAAADAVQSIEKALLIINRRKKLK